jgi:hypothetical protein
MDAALVQLVWQRAWCCCEYCRMPQDLEDTPFEIDHIISLKHNGPTVAGNLALSCFHDNSHKGSNIAGLDSKTGKLTPLFNPRRHKWDRHFRWQAAYLVGRTPIGRITVAVLNINDPCRIELREALRKENLFPHSFPR